MPHIIEEKGKALLKKRLEGLGFTVLDSDNKTYDLLVNGKYAEVKTKNKPFAHFDFASLTDKQFDEIQTKKDFKLYLVCNVQDEKNVEFFEIDSHDLRYIEPKRYTSHEYSKNMLDKIRKKL